MAQPESAPPCGTATLHPPLEAGSAGDADFFFDVVSAPPPVVTGVVDSAGVTAGGGAVTVGATGSGGGPGGLGWHTPTPGSPLDATQVAPAPHGAFVAFGRQPATHVAAAQMRTPHCVSVVHSAALGGVDGGEAPGGSDGSGAGYEGGDGVPPGSG